MTPILTITTDDALSDPRAARAAWALVGVTPERDNVDLLGVDLMSDWSIRVTLAPASSALADRLAEAGR